MSEINVKTVQVHIARFNPKSLEYEYLVLKRSGKISVYPGIWQTVTGTIELNETALEAAIRELKEETDLVSETIWCLPYVTSFFDYHYNRVNFAPVFGVLANFDDIATLSDEHSDFKWTNFAECHDLMVLPSHREGLRIFRDYCLSDLGTHYKVRL
ncbi:MAG: NUDIX pyrophosphatase [Desulfobulbaceae bacterium]|nr:NUDIX pyrophosphatase [Candidatus Kapabacteria bacterium]MBS4000268.1 NUDIX pyrophosphatase [Desulfobulbaceae bacterium]